MEISMPSHEALTHLPWATTPAVAPGHTRLILSHETDEFCLDIPILVVHSNCVRPIKYLRFLAIADVELLQEQGAYFCVYAALDRDVALQYVVDPEVIKARSDVSSSSSASESFRVSLVDRDASCIFTDAPPLFCKGTHIVPVHETDERNGMLLGLEPHIVTESRQVVVVKTSNLVLDVTDIPPRHARNLRQGVKYPDTGQRYTHGDDEAEGRNIPERHAYSEALASAAALQLRGHRREVVGPRQVPPRMQAAAGSGDSEASPNEEEMMDPDDVGMSFWA
ncbi:hypothetical protein C8R44DRAFT_869926 [Mycena epipterygia]|nr:hypothetical protein C8R44DRAFT_869926 [Mycena epipterygia]